MDKESHPLRLEPVNCIVGNALQWDSNSSASWGIERSAERTGHTPVYQSRAGWILVGQVTPCLDRSPILLQPSRPAFCFPSSTFPLPRSLECGGPIVPRCGAQRKVKLRVAAANCSTTSSTHLIPSLASEPPPLSLLHCFNLRTLPFT